MYESACKLMAKQKVALECLSYHATANNDDALKLMSDSISSAETYNLYSFTFIDFGLTDDDTCRATIRMFKQCDLIQKFHIPYDVLCRWILSVKKNYRYCFLTHNKELKCRFLPYPNKLSKKDLEKTRKHPTIFSVIYVATLFDVL